MLIYLRQWDHPPSPDCGEEREVELEKVEKEDGSDRSGRLRPA